MLLLKKKSEAKNKEIYIVNVGSVAHAQGRFLHMFTLFHLKVEIRLKDAGSAVDVAVTRTTN